ncbi:MAG: hypothetical protein ACOYXC_04130 [Candidatus Rifleibacteriota bacterium]
MRKNLLVVFVLVMVAFGSLAFAADVLVHEGAQVEITIPENWARNVEGDGMTVVAPNEEMSIAFMILDADKADKVLEQIDASVDKEIGKVAWENNGESKPENINGMEGENWYGTAQGGKIQVECIVLDAPTGKKLVLYWFDTPESEKKYEAEIGMIVRGLKPVAKKQAPVAADEGDEEGSEEGSEESE